jgi:dipeptidyl aminopeptidase/acylaminoacyl peptidase
MNANGTNQTRLTTNSEFDAVPVFSPDGSKIAFESTRDGNYEIYVMNANGTNQTRLTSNSANDQHPAFSPDGSTIAFDSHRDGNFEIYAINANGVQADLTRNVADDLFPSWQPRPLARTPVLTAYKVVPRSFLATDSGPSVQTSRSGQAKKPGAKVSFTLSETASVLFRVQQRLKGRRGRRLRGSFSFSARRGKNGFRFTGRLRGHKLRPGRYALVATPRASGKTGRPVSKAFRVTGKRHHKP